MYNVICECNILDWTVILYCGFENFIIKTIDLLNFSVISTMILAESSSISFIIFKILAFAFSE